MAKDDSGRRQTAADGGGRRRKEAIRRWRAGDAMADETCGIKLNVVWVVVTNPFFLPKICPKHPIFLPADLPVAPAKTNHYSRATVIGTLT